MVKDSVASATKCNVARYLVKIPGVHEIGIEPDQLTAGMRVCWDDLYYTYRAQFRKYTFILYYELSDI